MSKDKREDPGTSPAPVGLNLSAIDSLLDEPKQSGRLGWIRSHGRVIGGVALVALLGVGVMAKNGWLPKTDPLSGKKTGWFGKELPKDAASTWNPFVALSPSPTPHLSKEYLYAGSRLLAVADANAKYAPPADLAVWRASTGTWHIFAGEGMIEEPVTWGQNGDIPVQGDYDADGKTDFSVFRPSEGLTYIVRSSDRSDYSIELGGSGDLPVPADYDGDGKTDVVLWGTSTHAWNINLSSINTNVEPIEFGSNGDVPVSGDFDGDGVADKGYWRGPDHSFHSINSSDSGVRSATFGSLSGTPVCADYDGDGKTDFALLSGNTWTILNSLTNTTTSTQWQTAGDTPVPNDYDGDGKVDIAVFHPVTVPNGSSYAYWYIRHSGDLSTRTEIFGQPGDIPVPANYRR